LVFRNSLDDRVTRSSGQAIEKAVRLPPCRTRGPAGCGLAHQLPTVWNGFPKRNETVRDLPVSL